MKIIVEEKDGCVVYSDKTPPIIIDTPFYINTEIYNNNKCSDNDTVNLEDCTLVEGINYLHFFSNGEHKKINKSELLLEASRSIYDYGAQIAEFEGYKPFDEDSEEGKKELEKMLETITLIIMQINSKDDLIRIPFCMPEYEPRDTYSDYYVCKDFNFANFSDSIFHKFPKEWNYKNVFTYSFIFSFYFQKQS